MVRFWGSLGKSLDGFNRLGRVKTCKVMAQEVGVIVGAATLSGSGLGTVPNEERISIQ